MKSHYWHKHCQQLSIKQTVNGDLKKKKKKNRGDPQGPNTEPCNNVIIVPKSSDQEMCCSRKLARLWKLACAKKMCPIEIVIQFIVEYTTFFHLYNFLVI